jgi:phage-related minor tail protein
MAALLEGIKAGAQAVIDYVAGVGSRIKGSITGAASGAWSSVKSFAGFGGNDSPAIAGTRAAGGPVRAGLPYLVGERGPELFMPSTSGMVVPNHALARGNGRGAQPANVSVTINLGGVHGVSDPETIAARVVDITSRKLREAMSGIQSDIGYAAGM